MVLTGSLYHTSVGHNLLQKVQDRRSSGFYNEKKPIIIATEIPAQDLILAKEEVCELSACTASYWQ